MADQTARDRLRTWAEEALADDLPEGEYRHADVLGLLDLVDDAESRRAEIGRLRAAMAGVQRERDVARASLTNWLNALEGGLAQLRPLIAAARDTLRAAQRDGEG